MSAVYLGQRPVNSTVYVSVETLAADGSNVAPLSAFEAADVRIYKDASDVQRSSSSGITMVSPFDSLTGYHLISIDLSDNADAGFYAAGSFYRVVLTPDETVAGVTITARDLAYFDIGVTPANVTQIAGSSVSTTTAQLGVNIVKVNDVAVDGAGTVGDPWGPV